MNTQPILIVGESPHLPSGEGRVLRELLGQLAKQFAPANIECLALRHPPGGAEVIAGFPLLAARANIAQALQQVLRSREYSLVVTCGDPWTMRHVPRLLPEGTQWIPYLNLDGVAFSHGWAKPLEAAACVVTSSKFAAHEVRRLQGNPAIRTIPFGVDSEVYRPAADRAACRAVYGLKDQFVVGCIAQQQPRKQLPRLIEAFAAFARSHEDAYLLLHARPSALGMDLAGLLDAHNLRGRAGLVKGEFAADENGNRLLAQLYNAFDVFALPTMGEGFGLPILEAMACGVPVVVTDCSAVTELVRGRGELIRVREKMLVGAYNTEMALADGEHLVQLLEKLYADRALRARHTERGRAFAETLGWERCGQQWTKLLRKTQRATQSSSISIGQNAAPQPKKEIVIQRRNSIGDVLAASVVATRLKQDNPELKITFAVNPGPCSDILLGHPDIDAVVAPGSCQPDIVLDGAYENHPGYHTDHMYHLLLQAAGITDGVNIMPRIGVLPEALEHARSVLHQYPRPWVLCGLRSAQNPERAVPDAVWERFAALMGKEATLFACGGPNEKSIPGMVDWIDRFTIPQFVALMSLCDLVVTTESSPLHMAMATRRPLVAIGMATDPDLRALPQSDFTTVKAGLSCQPCSSACRFDYKRPPCGDIDLNKLAMAALEKLGAYRGQRVSALIPVYKPDAARLARCVAAARHQVDEIIIGLDGAGEYPLPDLPPGCRVVKSEVRQGFGRMMNLMARHSTGRYLLLLNDDLYLDDGTVDIMRQAIDSRTAVVGGCWRYPNGAIQHGGTFWHNELQTYEHRDRGGRDATIHKPCAMDFVTFAAALVRREAFYDVAGFDERYKMYWEDVDFCRKVRAAGWKVIYEPDATGIHEESATSSRLPESARARECEQSKQLYLTKWKTPIYSKRSLPDNGLLVTRDGGLGDLLMLLPLLQELHRQGHYVVLACNRPYVELMSCQPELDRVIGLDEAQPESPRTIDLRWRVDFAGDHSFSFKHPWFHTHHRIDLWRRLFRQELGLEVQPSERQPTLYLPLAAREWSRNFGCKDPYAVVQLASTARGRDYPHVLEVCRRLQEHITVIAADAKPCMELPPGVVDLCGKVSVAQLAAVVKRAAVIVGPDSGVVHLAGALNVPFVALTGPIESKLRFACYTNYHILRAFAECPPCGETYHCNQFPPPCLAQTAPQNVVDAALNLCAGA